MINLDDLGTISNDELASIHERINKEVKRRSGADINIKKLRAQVYKLAKSLGCEWVPESLPGELTEEHALPKRRGRKPKTVEPAQTIAVGENMVGEPAPRIRDMRVEEGKQSLWPL